MTRSELDRLIGRLSVGYRMRAVGVVLAEEALAALLIVAIAAVALSSRVTEIALLCGAVLALRAVWLWTRTRIDVGAVDRRLGLQERLATWAGVRGRVRGPAWDWLVRDLEQRLAANPAALGRHAVVRRFRPLRAVLPVLLALLLLVLFFPALPEGVLELSGEGVASTGSTMADGVGEEPSPAPLTVDQPLPAPADVEAPPDEPPPEEPEQPGPEPPEPDPKALLENPELEDAVAIPQFVGDGTGEVRSMPVAALDEVGIAPPPPAEGAAADPGGTGGPPAPEEADLATFQRALERAMRARNVPAEERPFVRRWFTSLVDASK